MKTKLQSKNFFRFHTKKKFKNSERKTTALLASPFVVQQNLLLPSPGCDRLQLRLLCASGTLQRNPSHVISITQNFLPTLSPSPASPRGQGLGTCPDATVLLSPGLIGLPGRLTFWINVPKKAHICLEMPQIVEKLKRLRLSPHYPSKGSPCSREGLCFVRLNFPELRLSPSNNH